MYRRCAQDNLRVLTWMTSPTVDALPPPISTIPLHRPFKAIGLDVRGADELLADFARRVIERRVEELGVAGEIYVIHPSAGTEGWRPSGVSDCDVLRVTFAFSTAAQTIGGQDVLALAADLLATQPMSEERSASDWWSPEAFPRREWVWYRRAAKA